VTFLDRAGAALTHRHFRLVWLAAIVNSAGSLMYLAAIGWVTAITTESPLQVTLVSFAGLVPLLVVSPVAGALGDRFSRRKVLLVTVSLQAAVSAGLAAAVSLDLATYPVLLVFAVLSGICGSLTGPVFQALIPRLVPPEALRNAIVLNSMQFNISRALGPTIAGVLLDVTGPELVFWINVVTFVPTLLALWVLPETGAAFTPAAKRSVFGDIVAGARYAGRAPGLRAVMTTAFFLAMLAGPIQWLAPIVATDGLGVGASSYGLLLGVYGAGAVVAGIVLLSLDQTIPYRRLATGGLLGVSAGMAVLATARSLAQGLVGMTLLGVAYIVVSTSVNSAMQAQVDDRVRGRVVSLWLMVFGGAAPIGLLLQGSIAELVDIRWVLAGVSVLTGAALLLLRFGGQLALLDHKGVTLATADPRTAGIVSEGRVSDGRGSPAAEGSAA
jgi:MFS family permease